MKSVQQSCVLSVICLFPAKIHYPGNDRCRYCMSTKNIDRVTDPRK